MTTQLDNLPLTETFKPTDAAEVEQIVRDAHDANTPVYPIGGGTRLDYGTAPTAPGVGLSLTGLDRIVAHEARDLTVTVEAGVTLNAMSEQLATERQCLPIDVPHADRATLGGVVATDTSGPRRYRWGTMRDYVIGIQAVDGRGATFAAGGRVVKNAAGYDMGKLLTGSLGSLGVITQVTLMVRPIPETTAWVVCGPKGFHEAEQLLAAMVNTPTLPDAIELLSGPQWRDDPPCEGRCMLAVGLSGTTTEVQWMVRRLVDDWGTTGVTATVLDERQADAFGRRLTQFPAAESGDEVSMSVQIGVLPSQTIACARLMTEFAPDCSIQSHAGDGVVLGRFPCPSNEAALTLNARLRSAVQTLGGSMVVSSRSEGIDFGRTEIWGDNDATPRVMRTIKGQFDPRGILNPGRFVV